MFNNYLKEFLHYYSYNAGP